MIICFEAELKTEWPKILRTMRLLNKRNEASIHLWDFLEFVVTHRTALYIQMSPFIVHKIGQPPISEHERNMQSIIRKKINGISMPVPKSRGTLLTDLSHDLKDLKELIEDRKFGKPGISSMLGVCDDRLLRFQMNFNQNLKEVSSKCTRELPTRCRIATKDNMGVLRDLLLSTC